MLVKLKLIVAALVIAAVPVCAQAQPTPLTKADAQNVFKIIGGDKAKTQTFCDMASSVTKWRMPTRGKSPRKSRSCL